MNGNGYGNFNNNSFNGMNNMGGNFDPQFNNANDQNQYAQMNQNMNSNMGGGSKFFNDNSGMMPNTDMMVGPNPFDLIRSYEETGNQENAMNGINTGVPINNIQSQPFNQNFTAQPQNTFVNNNLNPLNNNNFQPNNSINSMVNAQGMMQNLGGMQPGQGVVPNSLNVNTNNMASPLVNNAGMGQPVNNVSSPQVNNIQPIEPGQIVQGPNPFLQNGMTSQAIQNNQVNNQLENTTMQQMPSNIQNNLQDPNSLMQRTLENNSSINNNELIGQAMGNVVQNQAQMTDKNSVVQQNINQPTNMPLGEEKVQNVQNVENSSITQNSQPIENNNQTASQSISNVQAQPEVVDNTLDNSVSLEANQNVPLDNAVVMNQNNVSENIEEPLVSQGQGILQVESPVSNDDKVESTAVDDNTNIDNNIQEQNDTDVQISESAENESANEVLQPEDTSSSNVEVSEPTSEEVIPQADLSASYNTDEFEARFGVNYDDAVSKNDAIYKGLKYRITVLSEILIRLEYSDSGTFEDRPTEFARFRAFDVPKVLVTDEERTLTITTSYFELTYEKEKPFTGTKFSPDQYLKIKLVDTDKSWYFGHAEARNFKSTCSDLDDRSSIPKLEKGLYSTDGFVSLDDSGSLIFNQDGSVGKRNDARIDTYLFMYKKDFGFCLKDFYRLTGYPPLIPRYALGVWWNKDEVYDVNGIYSLIAKFRKYEIPISVLLLNNWSSNDVSFDKEKIPSPENMINNLHSDGIKLGVDLKLATVPSTQNGSTVDMPFNVYERGFMANYFNTFIKALNNIGVDFYSLSYKGDMSILRMINYYFYKYLNSEPNKRGMILSRSGLVNSHLYPINNSGEIIVDWKTLKMLPEFNSTASNLGISWWSHAIGGFKDGIEENELYTRFVQLGTYSPIFRFSSKGGHYYKREPWNWDVKTRKIVKDYTNLRHKMIPYLYSESYKYSKTGLPLIQPLYYRYPELYDEPTYRNEYYFGTELFIVPITERKDTVMNRTVTKIFLPNGMWYDFKTGKKFPGGKRYISFFQDEDYPVFAKQGAIIPQAIIADENRNFTGNPEEMEIHIFPGKNNSYKLYEDDGNSNAYKSGDFMTTLIDYNYLPNNYTVIIRPLEGKEGIIPEKRRYKIRFRNTRFADDVIVYLGSERIQVKMVLDDQDFIVETEPVSTKEQLSINCKGKDIEIDAVRIINDDIDTIISDLKIPTRLKEEVSRIMFSEDEIKKKRIDIRKLSSHGLNDVFVKMFLKLLEYIGEF